MEKCCSCRGHKRAASPPSQDGLRSLVGEIQAVQVKAEQDLLPPLSSWSQLEDAVPHPGQRGTGTGTNREKERKPSCTSTQTTPSLRLQLPSGSGLTWHRWSSRRS